VKNRTRIRGRILREESERRRARVQSKKTVELGEEVAMTGDVKVDAKLIEQKLHTAEKVRSEDETESDRHRLKGESNGANLDRASDTTNNLRKGIAQVLEAMKNNQHRLKRLTHDNQLKRIMHDNLISHQAILNRAQADLVSERQ
jgi:hypothetical protein